MPLKLFLRFPIFDVKLACLLHKEKIFNTKIFNTNYTLILAKQHKMEKIFVMEEKCLIV